MKILLAEDDESMAKIISMYLRKEGYEVNTVYDGEKAEAYFEGNSADLLLLDWMLPKKSGIEVCKHLRIRKVPVKIIMLTAKTTIADELQGLTTGADDYIRKPFDMKILLIRIKKLCGIDGQLTCRNLILNPITHEVSIYGEQLQLTQKEYDLLKYFLMNKNRVLSREQLLDHIWGFNYSGDIRTVDTHIRRLRKKLKDSYIETIIGTGYVMRNCHE